VDVIEQVQRAAVAGMDSLVEPGAVMATTRAQARAGHVKFGYPLDE
jgi:hypothetical protein